MTHKILLLLLLCGLAVGDICEEQQFKDIADAPYTIDPNMIAIDPASGQRLCLGWGSVEVGTLAIVDVNYCDPDGDPMTVEVCDPNKYTLSLADGVATVTFIPQQLGLHYITLSATDHPPEGLTAYTRTGTSVVAVFAPNNAPVFGCAVIRR